MNKVPVGVIGVGHLGKIHAGLYREVDLAHLVGIYDSDIKKTEQIAEDLNVTAYKDIDPKQHSIIAPPKGLYVAFCRTGAMQLTLHYVWRRYS